jgi:Protein of unknown function (DUF2892)
MPKNMGTLDRAIRTFVAIIFLTLYQTGIAPGLIGVILALIGIVFLFTSIISFCPLYTFFGITTCPIKKE